MYLSQKYLDPVSNCYLISFSPGLLFLASRYVDNLNSKIEVVFQKQTEIMMNKCEALKAKSTKIETYLKKLRQERADLQVASAVETCRLFEFSRPRYFSLWRSTNSPCSQPNLH